MANTWGESGTTWGQGDWGNQNNFTVSLTDSLLTTGSVGTPAAYLGTPYAAAEEGWGRDEWGYGNWGQNTTTGPLTT